jgi:hypothetical protein
MALMGYSWARGKQIHEKSMKSKISCEIPFNIKWERRLYGILSRYSKDKTHRWALLGRVETRKLFFFHSHTLLLQRHKKFVTVTSLSVTTWK